MFVLGIVSGKGGSGKTTTALSLAAASAARGFSTVLVDADPVGGASYGAGVDPDTLPEGHSLHDVLAGLVSADAAAIDTGQGFSVLAGTPDLAGDEQDAPQRFNALRTSTAAVMVIDTPPGFGPLVQATVSLADRVLVTVVAEPLAVRTLQHVIGLVDALDANAKMLGAVPTLHDARRALTAHQLRELEKTGVPIFEPIPRMVAVAEASYAGKTILGYAPRSPASDAYRRLALHALKGVRS
jgi:cellulose biosynthesis protein BcsQ